VQTSGYPGLIWLYTPSLPFKIDALAFAYAYSGSNLLGCFSLHIVPSEEQLGHSFPPTGARKSRIKHTFCAWQVCGCLVWLKLERNVRGSPTFGPACYVKPVSTTILSRTREFEESDPTQFVWLFSPCGNFTPKLSPLNQKVAEIPD
jgi:hypothetical protein